MSSDIAYIKVLSETLEHDAPFSVIKQIMDRIFESDDPAVLEELVVLIFHIRDIRGGRGDRLLFHQMMDILYAKYPSLIYHTLHLVPEYGYWKDFFVFSMRHPELLNMSYEISRWTLEKDEIAHVNGNNVSLFARWVPKEGKQMHAYASGLARYLYPTVSVQANRMAAYRNRITSLNAKINTVQIKMCAGKWDEIDPKSIPFVARKKSRAGFLNESLHDSNTLRRPDDPKRMECRTKFQAFCNNPPTEYMPVLQLDDARYDPIRQRVRIATPTY